MDYLRPRSLDEALALLVAGRATVLAGGTDFYPARVGHAVSEDVLDIASLRELRGIHEHDDHWRFGASTTWTEVIERELPGWFRCLQFAAREVGGVQIQNAGTIAGNLCNASPAADGVPALLALDAEVELASAAARRILPLSGFITANRRTQRRPDELVVAIRIPKRSTRARSAFLKLGSRKYLVISSVMVAGLVDLDGAGTISHAAFAVGACSPVAQRLGSLERRIAGRGCDPSLAGLVSVGDLGVLSPIDDVRGTADYRREAALALVGRLLTELSA